MLTRAALIRAATVRERLRTRTNLTVKALALSVHPASAPATKWILIAGPYRSGTGDNPGLLARNVAFMESFALPIFRAGHVPVIGEWLALPLVHADGWLRVAALRRQRMRWSALHANEASTSIGARRDPGMFRAGFGSILIDGLLLHWQSENGKSRKTR